MSLDEIKGIALKYLEKAGYSDCKILDAKDRIYKWRVEAEGAGGKFGIEISKAGNSILKFEHL